MSLAVGSRLGDGGFRRLCDRPAGNNAAPDGSTAVRRIPRAGATPRGFPSTVRRRSKPHGNGGSMRPGYDRLALQTPRGRRDRYGGCYGAKNPDLVVAMAVWALSSLSNPNSRSVTMLKAAYVAATATCGSGHLLPCCNLSLNRARAGVGGSRVVLRGPRCGRTSHAHLGVNHQAHAESRFQGPILSNTPVQGLSRATYCADAWWRADSSIAKMGPWGECSRGPTRGFGRLG